MTRTELEQHVNDALQSGQEWIWLEMDGDPSSSRQRLLGHHWGPKGWVVGWNGNCNVVRFNAQYVQDYLDELPIETLSGDDDVAAEVAAQPTRTPTPLHDGESSESERKQ